MIQTTVENLSRYESLNPLFPAAFAALKALAAETFTKGRHEVDGDRIFINAAEYETKPASESCMEHHRRYIDVMWMVSGEEIIGVCPVVQLKEFTKPYSEEIEAALAKLVPVYTEAKVTAGDVVILFPEDAHAPCMQLNGPSDVRKLIAKVEVTA
jgi:YhcH/YjgK/YiaL family protein